MTMSATLAVSDRIFPSLIASSGPADPQPFPEDGGPESWCFNRLVERKDHVDHCGGLTCSHDSCHACGFFFMSKHAFLVVWVPSRMALVHVLFAQASPAPERRRAARAETTTAVSSDAAKTQSGVWTSWMSWRLPRCGGGCVCLRLDLIIRLANPPGRQCKHVRLAAKKDSPQWGLNPRPRD